MKNCTRIKKTVVMAAIAMCFLLAGCGGEKDVEDVESEFANKYFDLHEIYKKGCNRVVYDKNTGVMYFLESSGYRFGITPIYNADGSLKLYDGYEIPESEDNAND